MPRELKDIRTQIRMVAANPAISTTLIQTEDLEALCQASERWETAEQALLVARDCVLESFDHVENLDDKYLAEGRLRDIDQALGRT